MSKIVVLASFHPKKNKVNEVKEIILSMIKPTRLEEGNELYNFYEEKNKDDKIISFHLFEIYKDSFKRIPLVIEYINENYSFHSKFKFWTFVELN